MKEEQYHFSVEESADGLRLDQAIAETFPGITRSSLKNRARSLMLNGRSVKLSRKVRTDDEVSFVLPPLPEIELVPEDIPFELIYIDHDIAVVNKPAGIPVHPSKGHESGTLVNGLLYRLGDKLSAENESIRPGIVHRLDMDTAGLLVIALNQIAHSRLSDAFKERRIDKTYHAVVKGYPNETGRIDEAIGRSLADRKKMAVRIDGKPALTEYRVIEYLREHSRLEIQLHTGRTHQIRVHLSHIRHPIAGDPLYSRKSSGYQLKGIALCAKKLAFAHPLSGKPLAFEIDLPTDIQALIAKLKSE